MLGKILRITAIVLFGLTVAFHLLGGIGTSCVALGAEKYDSMSGIVPYKWLYQLFVLITLAASVYGIYALAALIKGRAKSYRDTLIFLSGILLISGVHMAASQALRGKSAPTNMRVYFTILTLIVFLFLRIPAIWEKANLLRHNDSSPGGAAGLAAILAGFLTLSVQFWAGPSHIMNGGINYADAWHLSLTTIGLALVAGGAWQLIRNRLTASNTFRLRQGRLAPKT